MLVHDIRHQTSLSVTSGQRAQAMSHTAAQQKGPYSHSHRPHGKNTTLWCWR